MDMSNSAPRMRDDVTKSGIRLLSSLSGPTCGCGFGCGLGRIGDVAFTALFQS